MAQKKDSSLEELSLPASQLDGQNTSDVGQVFELFKCYIVSRLGNLVSSWQAAAREQIAGRSSIEASGKSYRVTDADALKFK